MKPEWKDITSYSRDESEKVPRSWEMRIGSIRLVVTRIHGIDGVWYMKSDLTGDIVLPSPVIETAKVYALEHLKRIVNDIHFLLQKV